MWQHVSVYINMTTRKRALQRSEALARQLRKAIPEADVFFAVLSQEKRSWPQWQAAPADVLFFSFCRNLSGPVLLMFC